MHRAQDASVIRVRGLSKWYGPLEAIRGVDFEVGRGEVFALLGPNGAGKTTVVEIMEGYRRQSAGEVEVLGQDPEHSGTRFRERIGIVLQASPTDPEFRVEEALSLYAGYYPAPLAVDEVLDLVGLSRLRDRRVSRLSGGEQRRLDVGLALVGDPELLFLDEPTTGFDPAARRRFWELIRNLGLMGKTIFLTTHYMEEAEVLADRVAVLVGGRIMAQGRPGELGAGRASMTWISFEVEPKTAGFRFAEFPTAVRAAIDEESTDLDAATATPDAKRRVVLRTNDPVRTLGPLLTWASERRLELPALEVRRPGLEEVYLDIVAGVDEAAGTAKDGTGWANHGAPKEAP